MRREELNILTAEADLWNNPEKAQVLMSEKNTLESKLDSYENFEQTLKDYREMIEFAEEENDEAMLSELLQNLTKLQQQTKRAELESLLSGEADGNDAYLEVHAGSDGLGANVAQNVYAVG